MLPSIVIQVFFVYFGILRPGLLTFHSLESKNLTLINQWLKYWVIFGIFQTIGSISNIFLGSLSFYDESKLILAGCVWLTSPYSIVRFYECIEPIFRFAEPIINNSMVKAKSWFYQLKQKEANISVDTEREDLKDFFFEEDELKKELSEVMGQNWDLEQDLVRTLKEYANLLPDPQTPEEAKKVMDSLDNALKMIYQKLIEQQNRSHSADSN
ncbi:uncharacterized protein Dwil_GK22094 [Drosophila willistoni]|uniref:Receptor expression-enhancing protein n=1 Tax=Drosophila willistoni TaxID=7260 RepID=B4MYD1_DROWI|nr:receptor expression-enhancing protein 4 [Drosophila willistoni]EDW77120.2 uncharacterized protein Dwil_GK22094 [Drosophila willistoni]